MRKALQYWIDNELTRLRHTMVKWQKYTADAIARRERNRRLLRQAVLRMLSRLMARAYEGYESASMVARQRFALYCMGRRTPRLPCRPSPQQPP